MGYASAMALTAVTVFALAAIVSGGGQGTQGHRCSAPALSSSRLASSRDSPY